MSFLRNRLSQIWRRSEDVEDHSTENRKRSESQSAVSIADSGCFSASSIRTTGSDQLSESELCLTIIDSSTTLPHTPSPVDSPSKRTLNKVASRTFKIFSDTIRSKTQMFYVTPEESEAPAPTYEESPKKRKISIKASPSFRGRANREPQVTKDSREPPARTPTPTLNPTNLPHELNVYIPDASLLEPKPGAVPTELASILSHEDKGYFADEVDSLKAATPMASSTLVNHEASPYTIPPSVSAGSGRSQVGGSLFVKGNRECIPLTGALSPYRQAILSQKTQASPIEDSTETENHEYSQLESSYRPLTNRPNGVPSGLKDLFVKSTDDQATYARFKMQPLSPADYEAASEPGTRVTILPSTGSRLTWDKTRADREQRYENNRVVSAETESDTEDDMVLKLQPCRTTDSPEVLRPEERSGTKSSPTKLPFYKKVRFENPSPTSALEYAIEAIERSSGEALDAELDEPTHLTSALQYAVEAIERTSGASMVDAVHDPPSPTGAFTYAVEAMKQPSGPVLNAVMNPGGLKLDAVIRILRKDSKSQEPRIRMVFKEHNSQSQSNDEQEIASMNMHLPVTQTDDSLLKTPLETEYLIGDSLTHNRSVSAQSAATTDSCALTTHSKLCYDPPPFLSLHNRTTPVRRTSSINAEVCAALEHHEDQELLPKTPQSSRSVSGCSIEVQPPSPTKEKILMEDESPIDYISTEQQAGNPSLPLSATTLETGATWQSCLDHKPVLSGLSRSSSMCAPDGDFSLRDTEREICTSPDPVPASFQESRLESFVLQGLIPREAIRQVSNLINRMSPLPVSSCVGTLDKSAVRSNNSPEVGRLCTGSPEMPSLWGEEFTDEESRVGRKTAASSTSPGFPMDILTQMPYGDSNVVPLPTPWFESFGASDDDEAGSVSPRFSMDILPQTPFDEADIVPLPTSWFELPKANENGESDYMPLAPPLKREARSIKDVSLPSSNTQVPGASTPTTEFIAARLPVFGPSTTADSTAQVADNMQCGHGDIAKQVQSFRKKNYATTTRTKTRMESRRLSPQTSPLAILASQHSRKRSWKMRETSVDGGEFTYEAIGTLKPVLVTSSVKKGVWWTRHQPSPDGLDSPLANKVKEQKGSVLLPIGTTLGKKDIDSEYEALDLLPTGTTALIDLENRAILAEEITGNKTPVLFTTLTTTEEHSMEEPSKSEDRKGSVQPHDKFADDSRSEKEQRNTTSADDRTLPKDSQQDYEIDRIIDSLSATLSWKEISETQTEIKEGKTPMESSAGEKMVRGDDSDFAVVSVFPCTMKHVCRDFSDMSRVSAEFDLD